MYKQGHKFKMAIKEANLTQEFVAQRLGMTRQNLGLYFHRDELPAEMIAEIKSKFGIDIANDKINKDQAVELMRSALTRLEKLEADVQLLKLALLNKHENRQ